MENRINKTKAILLFLSGIISITAMLLLGSESEVYGFLAGYGYTALVFGLAAIVYTYFKNQKVKRHRSA
ncbi:hypothetical protein [Pontibacter sp. H249]|uniref:hypothetical protein n=1 Tax=Pontibacter sp. H249 TaxID=3133420 RepID=UPI0030BD714C